MKWKISIIILVPFLLLFITYLPRGVSNENEERFLDLIEEKDGSALLNAGSELLSSREFILRSVKVNGLSLQYAPEKFRDDREICLAAVEENGLAVEFVGHDFRNDKELFLVAAKQEICYRPYFLISQAGSELRDCKEFVLEVVNGDPNSLRVVNIDLRNDYDVVLQAAKNDGSASSVVTNKELLKNEDIVDAAVQSNGCVLKYLDESFRRNKHVVLKAVERNPLSLEFADDVLKQDKDVVMLFFKGINGYNYEGDDLSAVFPNGLCKELATDEEVALQIIFSMLWKESLGRLRFISDELFHDENFIWKILNYRNGSEWREFSIMAAIPEEFQGRTDIVAAAVELDRTTLPSQNTLSYASEEIRSSKELCLDPSLTYHSYREFQEISEELRGDKDVVLQFVRKRGVSLQFASEELRCDRDVVLEAIRSEGRAIEYACEELQNDREVVLEAVSSRGFGGRDSLKEHFRDDKEIVLEAVKRSGSELSSSSERLKDDKEVVLEAVKEGGVYALTFASDRMQNDRDVVFEAVKKRGSFSLNTKGIVVSERFRNDEVFVMDVLKAWEEPEHKELLFADFDGHLSLPIGKKKVFIRRSLCSKPLKCYASREYFRLGDYEIEEAFEIMTWWKRFRFLSQTGRRLRMNEAFLEKFLRAFGPTEHSGVCDLIYDERFERRRNKLFVSVLGDRFFTIVQEMFGCALDYDQEKGNGEIPNGWFQVLSDF